MEKALTKVGSLKVGSLWISKKAKEELANITDDFNVSFSGFVSVLYSFDSGFGFLFVFFEIWVMQFHLIVISSGFCVHVSLFVAYC